MTTYSDDTTCGLVKDFVSALMTARRAVMTEYCKVLRFAPTSRTFHRRFEQLLRLRDALQEVLREQVFAHLGEEQGLLLALFDDTPLAKTGRTFEGERSQYDHVKGCFFDGFTPCSVALYRDGKVGVVETTLKADSKLKAAIAAFESLCAERTAPDVFLFDAWYASMELLTRVEEMGRVYITRLKSNRQVLIGDEHYGVRTLAASISHEQYAHVVVHGRSFWIVDTLLNLKGLGTRRVLICKDAVFAEPVFLVTNNTNFSTKFVLVLYQKRFAIEVFFKDAKQLLNFSSLQCRSAVKMELHFLLVQLAHWCLQRRHSISKTVRALRDSVENVRSYINQNPLMQQFLDALHKRCQT
jgi:hypothetical protein